MSLSACVKRGSTSRHNDCALVYGLTPPKRGRFEFGLVAVRYLSRYGLVWTQTRVGTPDAVRFIPTCGARAKPNCERWGRVRLSRRGASHNGAVKDETLNRCVTMCEATRCVTSPGRPRARGKLVTRQYQMERDQTILIALTPGA